MRRNRIKLIHKALPGLMLLLLMSAIQASPLWTFESLTATKMAVPANGTATVQYRITNQSKKRHNLAMRSIRGISQITTGFGICRNPFILNNKESCILSLQINGTELNAPIMEGPVVCNQGNNHNQCYQPNKSNTLQITQAPPILDATIAANGSPLTLTVNGASGQLIISNSSTEVAATNITSNFTGTALDGNVIETGNTCALVPPGGSCTITYIPGNTVVPLSNFSIQGTNTNVLTAAIKIESGSTLTLVNPNPGPTIGGAVVTLTGSGLNGATAVTFGGSPATNLQVINSTSVTVITPAHIAGDVDVVIDTPAGGATLINGYSYVTPIPGQASSGGIIACANGGTQNLIATTSDISSSIKWGTFAATNASGDTDGKINTDLIIATLGAGSYAARSCYDYSIDSQGNSPCLAGNICYSDWFLPAKAQLNCLYTNRGDIGGFFTDGYWSSTEYATDPARAWRQLFNTGSQGAISKGLLNRVRCVRNF
ncbi:IPT/TIG domain-containing protein [Legionella quateirensis]|uniref:Protein with a bacterial immunoglobulin-like domain n=1 Tax=Legionella quateirensis TaxID=45072 RepID=A0A378KTQ6_9GAMM|nr:IPT/TIG domain-containing protein [Legionella quateirensis]KTD43332.1 protein with a bacterial immunoglobulin-like domain protein [Legionella quateirensis]STY18214.1 protein with a bacterial immunoglobulin-like domain [Legionella quateirensis]